MSVYLKKDFYEEKIKNKVKDIEEICKVEKIPYFMTFAISNDNNKTEYATSTSGIDINAPLSDDKIVRHINVMNGFSTIPGTSSSNVYEEDLDDLTDDKVESKSVSVWEKAENISFE